MREATLDPPTMTAPSVADHEAPGLSWVLWSGGASSSSPPVSGEASGSGTSGDRNVKTGGPEGDEVVVEFFWPVAGNRRAAA